MGFSRQEYWSGLSWPPPGDPPDLRVKPALAGGFLPLSHLGSPGKPFEVVQSCLTLCDPMDCGLPGSSAHGIFQARVLEWGAIAFFVAFPSDL